MLGLLADAPKIQHERAHHKEIDGLRPRVPDGEGPPGPLLLLSGSAEIFRQVQRAHFRLHPKAAGQAEGEENEDQAEVETPEWPSAIQPFPDQMRQRNSRAPILQNKIARHDGLRRKSHPDDGQLAGQVGGEEGGKPNHQENGRAAPNCGIEQADELQKSGHASKLWNRPPAAKQNMRFSP